MIAEEIWETRARFNEMRAAIDYLEAVYERKVAQHIAAQWDELTALGEVHDENAPDYVRNFRRPMLTDEERAEIVQKLAEELAKKAPKTHQKTP